jgi:hypothetical protein
MSIYHKGLRDETIFWEFARPWHFDQKEKGTHHSFWLILRVASTFLILEIVLQVTSSEDDEDRLENEK